MEEKEEGKEAKGMTEQTGMYKYKHTTPHLYLLYLLFSLIDSRQKHQLWQKHGCCCVWMDAPSVGLETSEAGEHQDSEEECQHGDAQRGVCDQSQRLQIPLQLLLIDREEENERGCYWIYIISVRVDKKMRGVALENLKKGKDVKQTRLSKAKK